MIMRPVDSNGDVLPVLSSGDLLRRAEGVAQLVRDRLTLFIGEWWENSSVGFWILERFQYSRITEQNASGLCSEIAGYIRGTPGVLDVEDIRFSVVSRRINFSCTVKTAYGEAKVSYNGDF